MTDARATAVSLLADALAINPDALGPDTAIGATPEWDSLAHMRLILALEKHLGHQLSAGDVLSITSLRDVRAILGAQEQPR